MNQQELLSIAKDIAKEIYIDTIKQVTLESISNIAKTDPDGLQKGLTETAALSIMAASAFLETLEKTCTLAQND